jgi:hypothetical protein
MAAAESYPVRVDAAGLLIGGAVLLARGCLLIAVPARRAG